MWTIFLVCAVIGGTVLVCQFTLTLLGLGGDHGGDFSSHGGDIGHADVPDGHADVPHAEVHADAHGGTGVEEGHDAGGQHGSTWLFGVISFRTIVAALTFFGLSGMACISADQPLPTTLTIAIGSGLAAMLVVHSVMRLFFKLAEDGTIRVTRAIGREAKVYIPIPAHNEGVGKVQVRVQDRLVEYTAVNTSTHALKTGARVLVVAVRGGNTLVVRPVEEESVAT
ncbi:MAG: NfeD family protein [Pirellulales bacterium]